MLIVVIDSYRYNEIETDPLARARETNATHSLCFRFSSSVRDAGEKFVENFLEEFSKFLSKSRLLKLTVKETVLLCIYFKGIPMNFLVDASWRKWTILCIIVITFFLPSFCKQSPPW